MRRQLGYFRLEPITLIALAILVVATVSAFAHAVLHTSAVA
jgi:methionine-rich copper-binding protein CopC